MLLKSRKILASLATLPRHPPSRFSFSTQQPDPLTVLEHKAYLASLCISRIRNIQPKGVDKETWEKEQQKRLKQKSTSLRDQLVKQFHEKTTQMKLNQEALEYMVQMFTKGIKIDKKVLSEIEYIQNTNSEGKDSFVFFPTWLVTGQIFNLVYGKIQARNSPHRMLAGHSKISKSVSIMLLHILSNIIAQYNFKTAGIERPLKKFIIDAPKVIYLSFRQIQTNLQRFLLTSLRTRILKQCETEIDTTIQDRFFDIQDKTDQKIDFQDFYTNKQIDVLLIIDQFHQIISALKYYQKYEWEFLKQEKSLSESDKQFFQYQTLRMIKLKRMLRFVNQQFKKIVCFSSVNIQQTIIKKFCPQIFKEFFITIEIDYLKRLPKTTTMLELIEYFLFEFQNTFRTQVLNQAVNRHDLIVGDKNSLNSETNQSEVITVKDIIKKELLKILQNQCHNYALFPLMIIDILQEQQKKIIIQRMTVQDFIKFQAKIKEIFNEALKASKQQIKKNLSSFFVKRQIQFESLGRLTEFNHEKHSVILALYYGAITASRQVNTQNLYEINFKAFNNKIKTKDIVNTLDRNLFFVKDQKVYSYVPPGIMIQFLKDKIEDAERFFIQNRQNDSHQKFQASGFLQYAEMIFIKMLYQANPSILLSFSNQQYMVLKNLYPYFKTFQPIPRVDSSDKGKNEQWYFLKSFEQTMKDQMQNLIHNYEYLGGGRFDIVKSLSLLFIPNKNDSHHVHNNEERTESVFIKSAFNHAKQNMKISQAKDFIIISFQQYQKQYFIDINLFDMSLSEKDQTFAKLNKFLKSYISFADKHQNSFKLENGRQAQLSLNYFIINSQGKRPNFIEKLNCQEFQEDLAFTSMTESGNLIKVQNKKDEKPLLLQNIGYVRLNEELFVQLYNSSQTKPKSTKYLLWKLIEKMFKKTPIRERSKKQKQQ